MSNLSENKCTPEIRFAGFTDPWEQRKLGDLLGYEQPQKYIVDVDEYSDRHKIPVLTAGKSLVLGYTNETHNIKNASKVKPSIIFDDFTTSVHFIEFPFKVKSSAMKLLCPYNDMTDSRFCFCLLRSINYIPVNHERHWISTFSVMDINACSYNEQHKIGSMFSNIDTLITLHQRKLDKLKDVKQSLLEKMFPSEGESVPEIRFNGFTDSWEQRKLGELLVERNFKAPTNDNYPLMAFIARVGVAPKGERYDRSSLVNDADSKLYKRTEFNDFIYSSNNLETGSIGLNKYGSASISPVYSIFYPTELADSDFLGRRLTRKDIIFEMIKWRQGVIYGQWRIHESDFQKIKILLPVVKEQEQLGLVFDQLDTLITLHQRKLDKLKDVKQSLLENMFSSEGESVPEIRFNGFTDSWEQRKLRDCLEERIESYPDGELISVTLNDGVRRFKDLNRRDNSNDDKSKYKKVCIGDIAYNSMRMWQGASGYSNYLGIVSPAYTVLKPDESIYAKFIACLFKTKNAIRKFELNSQGISSDTWNLKYPVLSLIEFRLPDEKKEQMEIAELFSTIDTLITLHQCRCINISLFS